MTKKIPPYLLHVLGSALFLSIPIFSSPDFEQDVNLFSVAPFLRDFSSYVLLAIFFYVNYLYLIPKFYFTGKRKQFYLLAAICFLIVILLPFFIASFGIWPVFKHMPPIPRDRLRPTMHFFIEGSGIFQFLLIFFLSFLIRINLRLSDIQNEKLKTEVSYLKAQINPHFLFNTLNSLYSLALIKSDDTSSGILKLSSIMRYVVTESSRDYVALDKELDYIRNYIALQQLRMDEGTDFVFTVKGSPEHRLISPLLLIPFIENAFKYGLNPEAESKIHINITIQGSHLYMQVYNRKTAIVIDEEEKTEQGTANTLKRLEYLYKGRYSLTVDDTETDYKVELNIELQ